MAKRGELKDRVIGMQRIRAKDLQGHQGNWRIHPEFQRDVLAGVLDEVGIADTLIVYESERQGGLTLIDGHLRQEGFGDDQEWPCIIVDLSDAEADYLLSVKDPIAAMAEANATGYLNLLDGLDAQSEAVQAFIAQQQAIFRPPEEIEPPPAPESVGSVSSRALPLDCIFTLNGHDGTCCVAVKAGLKYGVQSRSAKICPLEASWSNIHKVFFVDNEYHDYDHAEHAAFVKEWRPTYATTRDVMTREQCAGDEIEYYELSQILDHAAELDDYAENVIVIPKYDCLDQIPEHYVLGFSIPTTHGGTPVPWEAFKGRRIHLLGGSWKRQLHYLEALKDDVVSLDNNSIHLVAAHGSFVGPDGTAYSVQSVLPWGGQVTNPLYVAMAISVGTIGKTLQEIYSDVSESPG